MIAVTEMIGGHDDIRLGDAEDVAHLLRAVEVHDRHHDGTEVRRRPVGDASLEPVRELEHDDVTRPDAPGRERRRHGAGRPVDVGERAGPRANLRTNAEPGAGHGPETVRHHRPERGVVPPAFSPVPLGKVVRDGPQAPPALARHRRSIASRRPLRQPRCHFLRT